MFQLLLNQERLGRGWVELIGKLDFPINVTMGNNLG